MKFNKFITLYKENIDLISFTVKILVVLLTIGTFFSVPFFATPEPDKDAWIVFVSKVISITSGSILILFLTVSGIEKMTSLLFEKMLNQQLKSFFKHFFVKEKKSPIYLYALSIIVCAPVAIGIFAAVINNL